MTGAPAAIDAARDLLGHVGDEPGPHSDVQDTRIGGDQIDIECETKMAPCDQRVCTNECVGGIEGGELPDDRLKVHLCSRSATDGDRNDSRP